MTRATLVRALPTPRGPCKPSNPAMACVVVGPSLSKLRNARATLRSSTARSSRPGVCPLAGGRPRPREGGAVAAPFAPARPSALSKSAASIAESQIAADFSSWSRIAMSALCRPIQLCQSRNQRIFMAGCHGLECHRAIAALRAISDRRLADNFPALALPPLAAPSLLKATAAGLRVSLAGSGSTGAGGSSGSPVSFSPMACSTAARAISATSRRVFFFCLPMQAF